MLFTPRFVRKNGPSGAHYYYYYCYCIRSSAHNATTLFGFSVFHARFFLVPLYAACILYTICTMAATTVKTVRGQLVSRRRDSFRRSRIIELFDLSRIIILCTRYTTTTAYARPKGTSRAANNIANGNDDINARRTVETT